MYATLGYYTAFHVIVLTLNAEQFFLAIIVVFVFIIYLKMYSFNKFMKDHKELALRYKKDPETTQKEYDL